MIRAEVVDAANHIHAGVQAPLSARQVAGASGKASQPASERGVQSLNEGGVEHSPALRSLYQGCELCLSALSQSPRHLQAHTLTLIPDVLLDHLPDDHAF